MKYTVIYEKGPKSWGAYVPDLPGVVAAGDTREEAEALLRQAVKLHLVGMREEGQPVPEPSSFAGEVEISR
jgi:predicted RNase H-like HicB family nuclease